jgi:hypothetical protein
MCVCMHVCADACMMLSLSLSLSLPLSLSLHRKNRHIQDRETEIGIDLKNQPRSPKKPEPYTLNPKSQTTKPTARPLNLLREAPAAPQYPPAPSPARSASTHLPSTVSPPGLPIYTFILAIFSKLCPLPAMNRLSKLHSPFFSRLCECQPGSPTALRQSALRQHPPPPCSSLCVQCPWDLGSQRPGLQLRPACAA